MKGKFKRFVKTVLAGVLSLAFMLQAFRGLSLVSEASTETVIIPTAETVTVGNATTNGVTDSSIAFSESYEYNTSGGVFNLFSGYSDITSILNVLNNSNGTAFVLNFTEPIDVSEHNVMTVNAVVGAWTDGSSTFKVNIYGSGATDLAADKAVGSFETVGNFNQSVTFTLNLVEYADANGMVKNLTFRFETASTQACWVAFGAFRLSYDVTNVPYKELAFGDWGISVGEVEGSNIYSLKDHIEVTSLNHVAISGKVNFNGNKWLRIGGTEDVKHGGLWFGSHDAGLYMTPQGIGGSGDYFPVDSTEWEMLKNTEITLRVTFDKATDGSAWTVGVFINGTQKGSYTIVGLNPGLYIGIDSVVTVDMTQNTVVPYTELSFGDWGTSVGEMEGSNIYRLKDHNEVTSLDHVAIGGKVNFNGSSWLRIGGTEEVKHGGLWIGSHDAGLYMTPQGIGGSGDYFPVDATEWETLKNTEITLCVTFDKATDGSAWIVGISVNGTKKASYTIAGLNPGLYIGIDSGVTVDMTLSPAYTELRLSDWSTSVGKAEGSDIYSLTGRDDITSLDGVEISGKVNFNGSSWLRIGGTEEVKHGGLWLGSHDAGLYLVAQGIGTVTEYFPIGASEWEGLKNTEIKLRLTFDKAPDGSAWTVGIFVNEDDKGSFTFSGITPGLYIGIDSTITVDMTTSGSDEVEMKNTTLADFDIVYKEYTAETHVASTTTSSLLNTYFAGKVVFNKTNTSSGDYYICYAAQGTAWDGMRIAPDANGTLRLYDPYDLSIDVTLTAPETLGSFVGTEFELGIELWESGNNAKLNIFIDGTQYNNAPYVWTNAVKNNRIGNNMNFIVSVAGDTIIVGEEQPLEQLPTDFMEITLNDFGIADGIYTEVSVKNLGINGTATLDRKVLSMDINCVDGGMQLFYGAQSTDWSGLYFLLQPNNNQIVLTQGTSGSAYTFKASEGGFDLSNGSFVNLKITTEYVDGSETDSDLKVGVFINGVLYENKYIVMNDFVASISDGVSIHRADGVNGSMTVSTPKRLLPSNYDQKTFVDVGIGDCVDRTGAGTSLAGTYIDWDGMIFSGRAAFATHGSEIRFGAAEGGWVGSQFIMSDGKLTFNHAAGTFGNLAVWEDITLGDTFSFSIATQYVDIDGANGENDLRLGLWVNGEMYGNRWFYVVDYTMYEGDTYAISFCMNEGTCSLMSYLPSTTSGTQDNGKYYYNLAEGGYLLSVGGSITVNEQTMSNGDVLKTAGDYLIARTEGNSEYTTTVVLWQTGDAHPDGKTTSADLVAIKKVTSGVALETEAGLKGADVTKDSIVNADDLAYIRDVLLGLKSIDTSISNTAVSYTSGEAKVMPIGGFYGPYGELLTEDVYAKIKDSGINLVTYSNETYNVSGESENVLKQLELAEKYGVSLFVRDSALTNNTYTATELANKIAAYSMYNSFKGLTVVDEPSASDGTYGTSGYLNRYNALSSSVNRYANLTAYVNLYPLANNLGDSTAYANYLDEYCTTFNPKMLSYDDYPFNEGKSVTVKSCAQYFENLAIVRNKALEENIPFWTFVQAGKWYNNSSILSSSLTESQMKWNANIALAFGAQGIQYFPLVDPSDTSSDTNAQWTGNGLLDTTGNTTEWYTYAKKINAQIAAVDDVLMNSTNQGIMVDGYYAEKNISDCGVTILETYNEVTGITSSDTSSIEYGAVVGCFDYQGKTALYIVNYNTGGANNVTLTFDTSCKTQKITSEGISEATGTSLKVTLAAGEAALVIID